MKSFTPYLVSRLVQPWNPNNNVSASLNTEGSHGPCEFKIVHEMELLGKKAQVVGGQKYSWDVIIDNERWEVKDVSKGAEVRLTDGVAQEPTFNIRFEMIVKARDLSSIEAENQIVKETQQFFSASIPVLRKGEISKGFMEKWYQNSELFYSGSTDNAWKLPTGGRWINGLWNENSDLQKIFSHVQGVIIVHPTLGYAMIPREQLSVYLKAERITQSLLRLKLTPDPTYKHGVLERRRNQESRRRLRSAKSKLDVCPPLQEGEDRLSCVPEHDGGAERSSEILGGAEGDLLHQSSEE